MKELEDERSCPLEKQCQLSSIGGRVKAAGVSFELLYNPRLSPFIANPNAENAHQTALSFKRLRDNPPGVIRSAFFPRDRGQIKAICSSSPALLRPMLKTDQGAAGNFLGFRFTEEESVSIRKIGRAQIGGMVIPEAHLLTQMSKLPDSQELLKLVKDIQLYFSAGDEFEAMRALERFEEVSQINGIDLHRNVDKGRGAFFFIHPTSTEKGLIQLPNSLLEEIELHVHRIFARLEQELPMVKGFIAHGATIEEAYQEAFRLSFDRFDHKSKRSTNASLLYCQPDVIVRADGSFDIDRINMPDVGFFLTQLNHNNDPTFSEIQQIAHELQISVGKRIINEIKKKGAMHVTILTRDEVVDRQEDTLEILEAQALSSFLAGNAISSNLQRLSDAGRIDQNDFVLLLNISPKAAGFEQLVRRYAQDYLFCYPNPLLLTSEHSTTTLPTKLLSSSQIASLRSIVDPMHFGENDAHLSYRQMLSLQYYLQNLGFVEEDIFYFTNEDSILAPVFRYDVKGFMLALNEFRGVNRLELRGLKFKPKDAVIKDDNGARLASFRFMAVNNQ